MKSDSSIFFIAMLVPVVTAMVLLTSDLRPDKVMLLAALPMGLFFALYAWHAPHVIALALVALIPMDAFSALPGAMKQLSFFKLLFPLPLFVLFAGRMMKRFEPPGPHPMDKWLLGWTLLYFFLIPTANDPLEALDFCRRWLSMALFYFLLTRLFCDHGKIRLLTRTIIFSTLISSVIGLWTYVMGDNPFSEFKDAELLRITGATGMSPNHYAILLFLPMWLAVGTAISAWDRMRMGIYYAIAFVISISILLTFSRSAFLVFSITIVSAIIIWRQKMTPAHWSLLFVAALVGVMLLPASVWERISSVTDVASEHIEETSLWRRKNYLRVGQNIVLEHPFFGAGPGNFAVLHAEAEYQTEISLIGIPRMPHNMYLQSVTETGIVGLLFMLGVMASAFMAALRGLRQGDATVSPLAGAALLVLIALMFMGFFSHMLLDKHLWLALSFTRILSEVTHCQQQPSFAS